VTAGLAVITGTEDRQHAYVALTRGTHDNTAYVFTQSPKRADITPGPRPAPELARYDRLTAQASDPAAPATTEDKDPVRNGCGGRCAPRNSPAWTPLRSWRKRSASGT